MYISTGNASDNHHVGLLFIDFEQAKRLRVSGTASLEAATSFGPVYQGAQFVVKVTVQQVFPTVRDTFTRFK
jgi:hypothetical protein